MMSESQTKTYLKQEEQKFLDNIVISTPTGLPNFVWTEEQKANLLKAFEKMAKLEEKMKKKT
jgi:hypothetical protein